MNRAGAALVLALCVLLVLEGVVLGTVYLTVQERRIADNGVTALRLRLAAESAARAAAATWSPALDSLAPGAVSVGMATSGSGLLVRTIYQRIDGRLFLAFAEVAEPPPRAGRARAALLVEPPLLAEHRLPQAALTAGAGVMLQGDALLDASAPVPCGAHTNPSPDAVLLPAAELLQRAPGAVVDGPIRIAPLPPEWNALIPALSSVVQLPAGDGLIAVDGSLTIPADGAVRGVVLVHGDLIIEQGAIIEGVVLATGTIEVKGTIRFDRCAAHAALRSAGLHRPRPHAPRPAIPAF